MREIADAAHHVMFDQSPALADATGTTLSELG
jgi:hypothetical protein